MSETDFLAEAAKKHQLNKNQIIALLGEDRHEKELFAAADAVRKELSATKSICADLSNFQTSAKTTASTAGCVETTAI